MTPTREGRLFDAFASLADTMVVGYDIVELLQTLVETCQSLLDVSAAGILLAAADGELELVASTSEQSTLVEAMQLAAEQGPCIESFTTGEVVSLPDIEHSPPEWAQFQRVVREQGFRSVYAIPLKLRDTTIGSMNLMRTETGELNPEDVRAAQAMADMATIGILHQRALRDSDETREQLQRALNSRVLIEQAKGVLAQTHQISMDEAFARLRSFARANRQPMGDVAERLVQRTLIF
ncbi:MAG: transcriptional regulator [Naasia sp.]|jgi:GAF domain-containing protein|uniref:GAF and ANTAR domain-containing protein n=1 Tax=Naasia sp. TaxID=2546198 RepID=UPI002610BD1C|nr:GAF and ANTAR domain-containing protein [Naasia sp.]MCU1571382.1 transcriptional regulator [Naasia sp.]